MKLLWKLGKEAIKYKGLYMIAIVSILALTIDNLSALKILSSMTAIVAQGASKDYLCTFSEINRLVI